MIEHWVADDPPRHFQGLADASEFLGKAYPGNQLKADVGSWTCIWNGYEICRLVDDGSQDDG